MLALAASSLASLALAAATVQRAVADALSVPGARVELLGLRDASPRACAPLAWSAPRAIVASGPVALRFEGGTGQEGKAGAGARCQGWAWADVKVYATALRLTRDVRSGQDLAGLVEAAEVEVSQGRRTLSALPGGAAAARALRAGTLLSAPDVRVGPAPGDPVTVLVRSGALELSLPGRAMACRDSLGGAPGSCVAALLPGGRRVEGRWDGAHIAVEAL